MSEARLPARIEPKKLAAARARLVGDLSLAPMERLGQYLSSREGRVSIGFDFGYEADGTLFIKGHFRTEVVLECQRCMEAYRQPLEGTVRLGVVAHESLVERLPDDYDPLVMDDEPVSLSDLVEDELILTLPTVPKHPEGECREGTGEETAGEDAGESDGKRENPFAVLSVLKTGKKRT